MDTVSSIDRELVPVLHVNMVTGPDQRIFCRKQHALLKIDELPCRECSYFRGTGQGDTIQCEWDDFPRLSGSRTRIIYPAKQSAEFRAVSAYIDDGMLDKG